MTVPERHGSFIFCPIDSARAVILAAIAFAASTVTQAAVNDAIRITIEEKIEEARKAPEEQ